MKKKLLVIVAVVGFLTTASAQTYILGLDPDPEKRVVVKIEEGTLFYNGGGMILDGDQDGVVINDGHIIVEGDFKGSNAKKGGAFLVNTYTDENNYGQLKILNSMDVTASIGMEKRAINPGDYPWGQFAIPFKTEKASDLMENLFDKSATDFKGGCPVGIACGPRLKQSMMVWDNVNYRFDAVPSAAKVDPTAYYILNLQDAGAGIKGVMTANITANTKLVYKGQPSPEVHTLNYTGYTEVAGKAWNAWKGDRNAYFETYGSYIREFGVLPNDEMSKTYGKNIYQIGNPYTSNVDLASLASVANMDKVYKVGTSLIWNPSGGLTPEHADSTKYSPGTIVATYNGTDWTGEPEALLLKPFEGAIVKLKADTPFVFTFNDDMKTFEYTTSTTVKSNSKRGVSSSSFYQLGLVLLDKSTQKLTDNRVYVATGSSMVTGGERGSHEAAYSDFNDRTGIYLLQENLDETANTSEKLFINTVNDVDYVGKPIVLGFNADRNNKGTYVIKSRLNEGNLAPLVAENYTDGSTFYFHDKKKDFITEVTSDFSYEFTETESTNDRFVLYWNDVPESLGVGETVNKGSTIVYKDGDDHKIRFNKDWKVADISVYDLSGRLVLNKAKVATTADYTVRLPKNVSSVYVIKVVGDNGDVVTKKIVKK